MCLEIISYRNISPPPPRLANLLQAANDLDPPEVDQTWNQIQNQIQENQGDNQVKIGKKTFTCFILQAAPHFVSRVPHLLSQKI